MLVIHENIKGKRYKRLMDFLSRYCNRFAFVENRQLMENEEERLAYVKEFISEIQYHLIERRIQDEWETTKLLEDTAYVYYFHLNHATASFLKERSPSLFHWIGDLPEDVMFYQNDTCLLAACSHEQYFVVDETIWKQFLATE